MMRRRQKRDDQEAAEINLTPMLDVIFIMLIFFIVTTSFIKETGIEINRPVAATAQHMEHGNIMIAVSTAGAVWIDGRQVDILALRANVERLRAESPESAVIIQADEAANIGVLVQVMDQVRLAGVLNMAIAAGKP
ncbi:MAG: biopolymer transporter ExbD [Desulfobulbaceae bacterium]|nr:MAG: biopolymer transporter ExbD [Desulfobulbaceae bacterium]